MLGVALAPPGLELWLGKEFSDNAASVLQLFLIGMLINGPAQVAFALIQAAGRSDLTARVHLIELPLYLLALWWMTLTFGIQGAALVWLARVAVDAVVLFSIARKLVDKAWPIKETLYFLTPAFLSLTLLGLYPLTLALKGVILFVVLTLFATGSWLLWLSPLERKSAKAWLRIGRQNGSKKDDNE
jgi:O-antigen/teichoic acid export membrane protein